MWLFVLERGTKAEFNAKSTKKVASASKILLSDATNVKVLSHKVSTKSGAAKKKGPMKADHSIGTVKTSEVSHNIVACTYIGTSSWFIVSLEN